MTKCTRCGGELTGRGNIKTCTKCGAEYKITESGELELKEKSDKTC